MVRKSMLEEILDLFDQLGAGYGTSLYAFGRCYRMDGSGKGKPKKTKAGTLYYDCGVKNVRDITPYCSPGGLTAVFEGDLYDILNYGPSGEALEKLDAIGSKYGQYVEMGDAWNLAFYPV